MKSYESFVAPQSDYYMYAPSLHAKELFLYPLCIGHFIYEKGYSLSRESYDSFLLVYIEKGQLTLHYKEAVHTAYTGDFILLNCYEPHAYSTQTGCEAIWCHFDGLIATAHCQNIESALGPVFHLSDTYPIVQKLHALYQSFAQGNLLQEALMSKYLYDILTQLHLFSSAKIISNDNRVMSTVIISYIQEHFSQDITDKELSHIAGLSLYHFIRSFKQETGFTPHDYLINTRLNTAKYLLKSTTLSVKDICFHCGFSSESVFCNAFKKHLLITPTQYRKQENALS